MNSYFNHNGFNEENKRTAKLPSWIWIIGIFGLIIAIISGYIYGGQAVAVYGELLSTVIIKDTNGDDTSLQTLGFSEFIGVFREPIKCGIILKAFVKLTHAVGHEVDAKTALMLTLTGTR